MKSSLALINIATAFYLLWTIIGIEGYHSDTCELESRIRCQVPSDGWSDCKDIVHAPNYCRDIDVTFKFRVCNKLGSDTVGVIDVRTNINGRVHEHNSANGMEILEDQCKWTRMDAVFNTCKAKHNWAYLKVAAKTIVKNYKCKDYVYWEFTAANKQTLAPIPRITAPPSPSPTFSPCALETHVSCNVRSPGWPSCTELEEDPILCGIVPVSMKYEVCNRNSDKVQLMNGKTNIGGKKRKMSAKLRRKALRPGMCNFQRRKILFDTCKKESFWSWFRVQGKTLDGNICKGYDFWDLNVETYTLPPTSSPTPAPTVSPTMAPTPKPCILSADASCQIVGNAVDEWDSCTNIVEDPLSCVVPVSIKFTVCNLEHTGSTELRDVKGVINGQKTTLDLIHVGLKIDGGDCIVQRKRAYLDTCNHDHYWAWIDIVGDAGCPAYSIWSHTMP